MEKEKAIVYSLVQGEEGKSWARRMYFGWNLTSSTPLCSWKGVLCDPQDDSVIAIELENVALKATIPSELGALSTLKALVLRKNQIYGTIPSQIAVLPKLEILDLSDNRITGTIPEFKSPNLIDLSLGFNRLTGTLPSDFGHGHELLVEMDIAWNKLTGIIPDSIGEMKGLNKLILSGNDLYGFIPESLGELHRLEYLHLDENSLIGRIPKELVSPDSKLSSLFLQGNDLSGTLPEALANLRYLTELHINGNKLTGEVPKRLCRAEINREFYENADELPSGMSAADIPVDVRDYCQSVSCPTNTVSKHGVWPCQPCPFNSFSPYLGTEGVCTTLNEEDILQLLWTTAYGPEWSKINNWNYDGVQRCSFTGVTCDEDGNVISIVLRNFNLRGTIPEEISGLKHLKVLDLSDNKLSGHIPSDLRFPPLEKLDLSGNLLAGSIPPLLCRSEANNNGKHGEYHCENIICPSGTYSATGGGSNGGCFPCKGDVDTLGRKWCSSPVETSTGIPVAEQAGMLVLVIIATLLFVAVVVFVFTTANQKSRFWERLKRQRVPDHEVSTGLSSQDPSIFDHGAERLAPQAEDQELDANARPYAKEDCAPRNDATIYVFPDQPQYNKLRIPNESVEFYGRRNGRSKPDQKNNSSRLDEDLNDEDAAKQVWLDVPRIS